MNTKTKIPTIKDQLFFWHRINILTTNGRICFWLEILFFHNIKNLRMDDEGNSTQMHKQQFSTENTLGQGRSEAEFIYPWPSGGEGIILRYAEGGGALARKQKIQSFLVDCFFLRKWFFPRAFSAPRRVLLMGSYATKWKSGKKLLHAARFWRGFLFM